MEPIGLEVENPMESSIFEGIMKGHFQDAVAQKIKTEEPTKNLEKMKPSEKMLYEIEKAGFNMSQMTEILKTNSDQLVVSCAGSGKTTTLIFKILYDIKSGHATRVIEVGGNQVRVLEKIWVCTFLNTGAGELQSNLKKWINKLHLADVSDSIQISTIHAEFSRALKQFGFKKEVIDSSLNSNLLKEVVKQYHLVNARGNSLNSEDYSNLESALSYTRNRLDGKRYEKEIYDELNIGASIIDAILRDWKNKRVQANKVDFDDMQELIYEECYVKKNEDLINFLANRYNFIYIDEFQDTSQLQYAVLKLYTRSYRQLFVIGDDDQTIYSWRGSDHKIITKDFPEDFVPKVNQLAINYRCPRNILNAIIPSITLNTERYDKPLESYKEGGLVRVLEGKNYSDMVESLADCVYNDLKNKRSVAILCRVNTDGLLPALMFERLNKFSYSISGMGMTLDSYIGRTVLSIIKLFTEKSTPAVKKALDLLAWDTYGINQLIKVCKTNKTSIWTIDDKDLSYSCPSIAERLIRWRKVRESRGEVEALKFVLHDYRTSIFIKDTQFNNVMRSTLLSVETMLNYSTYEDVESFLYDLEDINERLKGKMKNTKCSVKIATVHEFKGKEADSVYIWNDSVDVFPIKDAVMGTSEYEEERRIHYIACTRAKEISTVVYLKGKPGAFVNEMDLSGAEVLNGTKVLKGVLTQSMEEERNMAEFEKKSAESNESSLGIIGGVVSPVSMYSENEFWGEESNDPLLD